MNSIVVCDVAVLILRSRVPMMSGSVVMVVQFFFEGGGGLAHSPKELT